jgi:filamentous hemagglutinin
VLGTASASLNGGAFTATSNGGRVRMSPTGAFNLNNAVASLGVLSFEPSTQLVANASGSFAVGSVNFNGGLLDIQSGGTDTATYNLNNYGTLRFSGFSTRTISGAINGDGTGTLETQLGKTLSGVNINTSLTQVGTLAFSGVTTLGNGVTVSKGNSTWLFEAGASIATGGSSTPIATIANAGGSIYAAYNAAGGLTFGQGLTVRGYGAIRGDWASYAATLNNLGTIWSDTLGQTFTVNGNSLSNTGLLQATAGTMSLGPSSGVTNGGELLVNGGVMTVNVPVSGTGTATVQNGTMNLNAATSVQTMSLTGGTLGGSGDVSVTNSFTQTGGVINKTGSLSINQEW